jgi:uncharacterized protein (DUF4415 family)
MAIIYQARHDDHLDKIRRDQERAFAERANVDIYEKALSARRGRKTDPDAKKLLTLRVDPDVIEWFKAAGPGWQSRMNAVLRKSAGLS